MTIVAEDPFGLVVRRTDAGETAAVMVLPRTWPLLALAPTVGEEPEHGSRSLTSSSTVDEEFAALREYVQGDDIRRIHWPSTARLGTPVVRQFDVPWQRRTTVVVDVRTDAHDDRSFERAVSAAASVVELAAHQDELVRLVTTTGADSGFVAASSDLDELMDRLAVLETDPVIHRGDQLVATLEHLRRSQLGRPVICVGAVRGPAAAAVAEFRRDVDGAVVVDTTSSPDAALGRASSIVRFDGTVGLTESWHRTLAVTEAARR